MDGDAKYAGSFIEKWKLNSNAKYTSLFAKYMCLFIEKWKLNGDAKYTSLFVKH